MKTLYSMPKIAIVIIALFVSEISLGNNAIDTLQNSNSTLLNELDAAKKSKESDTIHIRMRNRDVKIISNSVVDTILIAKPQSTSNSSSVSESQYSENSSNSSKNFNIQVSNDGIRTIIKNGAFNRSRKFIGHYGGVEFGMNRLIETDYSMYPPSTPAFLELIENKSYEVNLNLSQYSIGLTPWAGFVTGLGINFNDYKFSGFNTIIKDSLGILQPQPIDGVNVKVNKLSTVYLTAPFLLEFQIKTNEGSRIYISGGVIGGLKLASHTKVKVDNEKYKNHRDLNLNQFRWGYTARIGVDNVGFFATYYDTKLFKDGMGPQATPFTFGISLNFDE